MAFLEVVAGSAGARFTVAFRSIANITTFSIPFISFVVANTQPERILELDLVVDGTTYALRFEVEDEAYHSRDLWGNIKKEPASAPGTETPLGSRPQEPQGRMVT